MSWIFDKLKSIWVFNNNSSEQPKVIEKYGWTYKKDTDGRMKWFNQNGQAVGVSLYAKLNNGKRVHFNTDGTVSAVNEYGYVGTPANGTPEGTRSMKQHIAKEIKNQNLSGPVNPEPWNKQQLKVKNDLYNELINAGFNADQAGALVMNAADESKFDTIANQAGGGAKGLFQFDGRERKEFETKYGNNWSIKNQVDFIKGKLTSKGANNSNYLHNYDIRTSPGVSSVGEYWVGDKGNRTKVPTDNSYMKGYTQNDTVPSEDFRLRGMYANKLDNGYTSNTGGRVSGITHRYTGLPTEHYVHTFMNAKPGEYTPQELSFMFLAGYEKAGKPHKVRMDSSIINK